MTVGEALERAEQLRPNCRIETETRLQASGCQLSAASTVGYSTSAYQNAVGKPSSTWFTSSTAPSGKR